MEYTRYEEYPRSQFPEAVDNFILMQDVDANTKPIVDQYNALVAANNWDGIAILKTQYPVLEKLIFNADKQNNLTDGLKATQKFFLEDVDAMIQKVAQDTVGINDEATDDQKATVAYSAEKTDRLIEYASGSLLASNVIISVSDWDTESITWTYENDRILADDEVYVVFHSDSAIAASKAFIYVKSDTGAGNLTLKANKTPKAEIKIQEIRLVRR